jgi:hypothetical protein
MVSEVSTSAPARRRLRDRLPPSSSSAGRSDARSLDGVPRQRLALHPRRPEVPPRPSLRRRHSPRATRRASRGPGASRATRADVALRCDLGVATDATVHGEDGADEAEEGFERHRAELGAAVTASRRRTEGGGAAVRTRKEGEAELRRRERDVTASSSGSWPRFKQHDQVPRRRTGSGVRKVSEARSSRPEATSRRDKWLAKAGAGFSRRRA